MPLITRGGKETIMKQIPCDIIKDLLPLYKDHVCSEKTKELIENHLPECESCREYLEAMEADLPPVTLAPDGTETLGNITASLAFEDMEIFQKIARRMNWMKVTIGFFAVIITLMVISLLNTISGEYIAKLPIFDKRIAVEDIRVTELYELDDGNLYVTLESKLPCDISSYGAISSPDGKYYTEAYDNGQSSISFKETTVLEKIFLNHLSFKEYSFVIPRQEIVESEEGSVVHKNTLIYYEGKDNEQLTLWKEGQEIEAAPDLVERRVQQQEIREKTGTDEQTDYEISTRYKDNILVLCID